MDYLAIYIISKAYYLILLLRDRNQFKFGVRRNLCYPLNEIKCSVETSTDSFESIVIVDSQGA